ncbi:MAG: hypothetical protein ACRDJO_00915 [Actinomycetota bacterium]
MARRRARTPRARSAAAESSPRDPELPDLPNPGLGQKVSILYRLPAGPDADGFEFSEVVGIVQRISRALSGDPVLTVVRRNGALVEVPRSGIVRMKIVPTSGAGPFRPPRSWGSGEA